MSGTILITGGAAFIGSNFVPYYAFVQDRSGHDFRYAIDATKLETELGWKANETFDTGIVKTAGWYLK